MMCLFAKRTVALNNPIAFGILDVIVSLSIGAADTVAVGIVNRKQVALIDRNAIHIGHVDLCGSGTNQMLIGTALGDNIARRINEVPSDLLTELVLDDIHLDVGGRTFSL